jgi:xylose isomerase
MPRFAIITSFLGETKDRFHTYNQPRSLEEKLAMVGETPGYTGVELVHPYEVESVDETRRLVDKHGLEIAAINVNVKAEPEFLNGGLTSSRPETRARAVRFIKEAKDFAAAVGAPLVTCCPLGDGFEFPFDVDYQEMWKRLCDTFAEAGSHRSEVPLFIEYKPKETRGRCFLNRASKTLCLLRDIAVPSMGITIDYGHSIYGDEHPAEVLALLEGSDFDYYVHINDNDKTWDWDLFCGSHTYLHYVEFVYYLKKFGYDRYITSDTHPTRWDLKGTFEVNARLTQKVWDLLDRIGAKELEELIHNREALRTWRFVEENILGLR